MLIENERLYNEAIRAKSIVFYGDYKLTFRIFDFLVREIEMARLSER